MSKTLDKWIANNPGRASLAMTDNQHKGYNGHKNYNHWNVSLWLFNDEYLYSTVLDCAQEWSNKEDIARAILSHLIFIGLTHTPDGVKYTYTSIRAALVGM